MACRLFDRPEGFPANLGRAVIEDKSAAYLRPQRVSIVVDGAHHAFVATCTFENVPRGSYAVAVFHDENGDGKLDTNFLGIPAEGVGVSNNRFPFVGPPSFGDARLEVDKDLAIDVKLKY